jgi:Fe-S-cluster-containing dehydrogenase component
MTSYAAVIDLSKCIDCRACVIQCKDEYAQNDYPGYSAAMPFRGQKWIRVDQVERGTFPKVKFASIPVLCQHCDNAPCMANATNNAVTKRADSIVLIDPVLGKGQSQLVNACPYGAIYYNTDTLLPQKCTLCAHRLDAGETPRCMQACPAAAIQIGDYNSLKPLIDASGAESFHPEYGTKPRVYYIGLPKTFIAGSVVNSKTGDCVAGATVTATDPSGKVVSTTSDLIGGFFLDGLATGTNYNIAVSLTGFTSKTVSGVAASNNNYGDITISPS